MNKLSCIGIDVAKESLVVAPFCEGTAFSISNDCIGLVKLLEQLPQPGTCAIIVKASTGYERSLIAKLLGSKHRVALVNPGEVRHWGIVLGMLGKMERIDARALARFGELVHPCYLGIPKCPLEELAQLTDRRLASNAPFLDAIAVFNAAENCARSSFEENLPDFLVLLEVAKAAVFRSTDLDDKLAALRASNLPPPYRQSRGGPDPNRILFRAIGGRFERAAFEDAVREVQDYVRDAANERNRLARRQMDGRYSTYGDSKARKIKRGRAHVSDHDYSVASQFEDAKQRTNRLVTDWCDARKNGLGGPADVNAQAVFFLRQAYSFRVLDAALECRSNSASSRSGLIQAVLEAVLIVFAREQAIPICRNLFKRPVA